MHIFDTIPFKSACIWGVRCNSICIINDISFNSVHILLKECHSFHYHFKQEFHSVQYTCFKLFQGFHNNVYWTRVQFNTCFQEGAPQYILSQDFHSIQNMSVKKNHSSSAHYWNNPIRFSTYSYRSPPLALVDTLEVTLFNSAHLLERSSIEFVAYSQQQHHSIHCICLRAFHSNQNICQGHSIQFQYVVLKELHSI